MSMLRGAHAPERAQILGAIPPGGHRKVPHGRCVVAMRKGCFPRAVSPNPGQARGGSDPTTLYCIGIANRVRAL
jgi:hypothetical protein